MIVCSERESSIYVSLFGIVGFSSFIVGSSLSDEVHPLLTNATAAHNSAKDLKIKFFIQFSFNN